jgi:hypothetical protein
MALQLTVASGPAATLAALACVVVGGPLFADGVRTLRRRRALRALAAQQGPQLREGTAVVRGIVGLESPLFAPLSARPCAGFVLEVRAPGSGMVGRVGEARRFRLWTAEGIALVEADVADWRLGVTAEREVESLGQLSENVAELLSRTPETRWLASRGGRLLLVERALYAGAEAGVLGELRRTHAIEYTDRAELARTGTDGLVVSSAGHDHARADWSVEPSEELDTCIVSDGEPSLESLAPSRWRVAGVVVGPVLALAGLIVLVQAIGRAGFGGGG